MGWRTYPYFVRLLLYVWLGCLYICALGLSPFLASLEAGSGGGPFVGAPSAAELARLRAAHSPFSPPARLALSFILCVAIGLAVSALLGWHVYLVLSNQTSIEYLGNRSAASRMQLRGQMHRNPHDRGALRNLQSVFGHEPWPTWLLPRLKLSPGDGWSSGAPAAG